MRAEGCGKGKRRVAVMEVSASSQTHKLRDAVCSIHTAAALLFPPFDLACDAPFRGRRQEAAEPPPFNNNLPENYIIGAC